MRVGAEGRDDPGRPGQRCAVTATNTVRAAANASLTVTNQDAAKLDFKNISPPATPINTDNGVQWSGTLSAAVAPKVNGFTDITGQNNDPFGYLPLAELGITPIGTVGDDTISNFSVPTFYWGGEPYTEIGVGSNGYVVIGGGDSNDVSAVPEGFPDTDPPNNVIAPFWTDLDPTQIPGGSSDAGRAHCAPDRRSEPSVDSAHMDRRRLQRRAGLQRLDDAHGRGLDPARLGRRRGAGPRASRRRSRTAPATRASATRASPTL